MLIVEPPEDLLLYLYPHCTINQEVTVASLLKQTVDDLSPSPSFAENPFCVNTTDHQANYPYLHLLIHAAAIMVFNGELIMKAKHNRSQESTVHKIRKSFDAPLNSS